MGTKARRYPVLTGAEGGLVGHVAAVVVSVAVTVQAYASAIPAGKLADPASGAGMGAPQDAQQEYQGTRPPPHPGKTKGGAINCLGSSAEIMDNFARGSRAGTRSWNETRSLSSGTIEKL